MNRAFSDQSDGICIRLDHLERDQAVIKIDVHDNKTKIVEIMLDLKEMAIAKKLVFATASLIMIQALGIAGAAIMYFLSLK